MPETIEELHVEPATDAYAQSGRERRSFAFKLHQKCTGFGDIAVRQFWMKRSGLYDRRARGINHGNTIPEYFWALCRAAGTFNDVGARESYVLAKLLPYTRRYAAKRIFDDAALSRPEKIGETKWDWIEELEQNLIATCGAPLDLLTFHRNTQRLLGRSQYSDDILEEYERLTQELLAELGPTGSDALAPDTSGQVEIFRSWKTRFARRRGLESQKRALDMISYECRAAFYRCYSAVWEHLIPHLEAKYQLDEYTVRYHYLMHREPAIGADPQAHKLHLFHGHIFALHPGISLVLQTPTGKQLIADVLRDPEKHFCRLLQGFWVGLLKYDELSERIAQSRSGRTVVTYVKAPDQIEAEQSGGQYRRGYEPGTANSDEPEAPRHPR